MKTWFLGDGLALILALLATAGGMTLALLQLGAG